MDFLFYVPFFCTAAAVITEIERLFVNEFRERQKADFEPSSHFVKYY
jgi:hypothetical protein